jgi:hypothetical protein
MLCMQQDSHGGVSAFEELQQLGWQLQELVCCPVGRVREGDSSVALA